MVSYSYSVYGERGETVQDLRCSYGVGVSEEPMLVFGLPPGGPSFGKM